MERIPWDQYFMCVADLAALRATCDRLKVGAVLVRDKHIIATGYNGSVSGDAHCTEAGCQVIENHCIRTIHAEMNALLQCAKYGIATDDAELYITHFPCLQCTKAILQAGIKKIYYQNDYNNDPYIDHLIEVTGVKTKQVKIDPAYLAAAKLA